MTTSFAEYAHGLQCLWARRSKGLVVLEDTTSSQVMARRWLREHQLEQASFPELDVLAWRQEGGIGRGGKRWSSPPGAGIYASLVRHLPPTLTRGGLQVLPLLISVALCDSLNGLLDGRCRIRWPNDLWVDGRKLAGLLIDVLRHGGEDPSVVIGFGVNYGPDLALLEQPNATSLAAEGVESLGLPEVAFRLVEAVDDSLAHWPVGDSIIEEYRRSSIHRRGDEMRCRVGDEVVVGKFLGFNRHGFLRLDVASSERLLSAGDLELGGRL